MPWKKIAFPSFFEIAFLKALMKFEIRWWFLFGPPHMAGFDTPTDHLLDHIPPGEKSRKESTQKGDSIVTLVNSPGVWGNKVGLY